MARLSIHQISRSLTTPLAFLEASMMQQHGSAPVSIKSTRPFWRKMSSVGQTQHILCGHGYVAHIKRESIVLCSNESVLLQRVAPTNMKDVTRNSSIKYRAFVFAPSTAWATSRDGSHHFVAFDNELTTVTIYGLPRIG
jgi:hypothetical protein